MNNESRELLIQNGFVEANYSTWEEDSYNHRFHGFKDDQTQDAGYNIRNRIETMRGFRTKKFYIITFDNGYRDIRTWGYS